MAGTLSVHHRINCSVNWHEHNFRNTNFYAFQQEMEESGYALELYGLKRIMKKSCSESTGSYYNYD